MAEAAADRNKPSFQCPYCIGEEGSYKDPRLCFRHLLTHLGRVTELLCPSCGRRKDRQHEGEFQDPLIHKCRKDGLPYSLTRITVTWDDLLRVARRTYGFSNYLIAYQVEYARDKQRGTRFRPTPEVQAWLDEAPRTHELPQ